MVGGEILIGCHASAGIRSAHSSPKPPICPPTPKRLLAQKFQADTSGAGTRDGRTNKWAATMWNQEPPPPSKGGTCPSALLTATSWNRLELQDLLVFQGKLSVEIFTLSPLCIFIYF